MAKVLKKFHVLEYKMGAVKKYDVLPYFRACWKDKNKYLRDRVDVVKAAKYESKRKQLLRDWIRDRSHYMFWGRCEYECLLASWPFGSYKMKEKLKEFLTPDFDIEDLTQSINFYNIIIADMHKIDVHEQIMMNIDVITDILFEEFKLNKLKS